MIVECEFAVGGEDMVSSEAIAGDYAFRIEARKRRPQQEDSRKNVACAVPEEDPIW